MYGGRNTYGTFEKSMKKLSATNLAWEDIEYLDSRQTEIMRYGAGADNIYLF